MTNGIGPTGLQTACRAAEASFHVFFTGESPAAGTFADRLGAALAAIGDDLDGAASANLYEPADDVSDPIDALNLLAASCADLPFGRRLDKMLFERLAALSPRQSHSKTPAPDSDAAFFYDHAVRLAGLLKDLIPAYCKLLADRSGAAPDGAVSRLRPSALKLDATQSVFLRMKQGAVALEIAKMSTDDPFAHGRIFRHMNGEFVPLTLPSIRSADEFYGYQSVRRMFQEHFKAFSEGRSNLPLLI